MSLEVLALVWAGLLLFPAPSARAATVLTTLHYFSGTTGINVPAGLIQGTDGYFYGITSNGGDHYAGSVFRLSTSGELTTLYSFTGGADGQDPEAALVEGSDGDFYGTTQYRGPNNQGTVFKIGTNGLLTTLYAFGAVNDDQGNALDGANPRAALVRGPDGDYYGTTSGGGASSRGIVFRIGGPGKIFILHSFTGQEGAYPQAPLLPSGAPNYYFYGTTSQGGGTNNAGTIFTIGANGGLTNLYSFTGGADGSTPNGLVLASGGYLYGTTRSGGTNKYGTVFKASLSGKVTSLYSFQGANDGAFPYAGLVQAGDGNFYGTTHAGFVYGPAHTRVVVRTVGAGTIFKITPDGALTTLYAFADAAGGAYPVAGLVPGTDGNLYGTTAANFLWTPCDTCDEPVAYLAGPGGAFKVTTKGALTTLHTFPASDGASPVGGLVLGSDGNCYGATSGGSGAPGTVFKMTPAGVLTSLDIFATDFSPALVQASDGFFYGTSAFGGSNHAGTVFRLSASGELTTLFSFTGGADGGNPQAALVQGRDGFLYGTTQSGGALGQGTVFRVTADGALTTLYSFHGDSPGWHEGGGPQAALVQDIDGLLYGSTSSAVFSISTNGTLTILYSFSGGNHGSSPNGLVQGADGNFYGTTQAGGAHGYGTIFKLTQANGDLTTLYSFGAIIDQKGCPSDGATPVAALIQGKDGYLYGTTQYGGLSDWVFPWDAFPGARFETPGTIFRISTNGAFMTLYKFRTGFPGTDDGWYPTSPLVQGSDGAFYGTTPAQSDWGGQSAWGTVFRVTILPAPPTLQAPTRANNNLTLTWTTEPGGVYQMQYNPDLNTTNWANLGSATTATGSTLSAQDSVTAGAPRRFYRVVRSQ